MKNRYKFSDFCDVSSSKRILKSEYVEKGVPFYRSKEIIEIARGKNISEPLYISKERFKSLKERFGAPKNGDILITSVGTLGVTLLVDLNYEFYFKDGNLTWLKNINSGIANKDYLIQWLKSRFFFDQINNNNIGAVQKAITISFLNTLEIELPDLKTQKQIAKVLSDLDAKIEINNKINAELEAMAKTIYDYWFVQFDFPDKNGKPYKSSGGAMVYNEVLKREIPVGWEDGTFESISTIIGGSTPSKSLSENFAINDNISWITPKDLSLNKGNKFITRGEWDVTELGVKNASLKIMPKSTVLLSSRAPIGYLAISRKEVTTNQGFKSFVPKGNYYSEFIYYCVKNQIPKIEAYSSGSTFKEVSSSILKTINISIPDKSILKIYYDISKPIFKKQDKIELENQKLAELRDWLLPMLMNGQVTVKEAQESVNKAVEV